MNQKTAVVTGANRGIGKEVARQLATAGFKVIMTGRDAAALEKASTEVGTVAHLLDVSQEESIRKFEVFVAENYPCIDVLVNNAGILGSSPMRDFNLDEIRRVMETNLYGPLVLTKYLFPHLKKSDDARVINVSSGMGTWGALSGGGSAAYRISKVMLNAFTLLLAAEMPEVKVFSMDPGWVKTEMGGRNAPRSVEKGAETITWLATSSEAQSGNFYKDKKTTQW